MPETWAGELQQRFDAACRAAERRHERQSGRAGAGRAGARSRRANRDGGGGRGLQRDSRPVAHPAQAVAGDDARDRARAPSSSAATTRRRRRSMRARTSIAKAAPSRSRTICSGCAPRFRSSKREPASENLSLKDAERILKDTKLVVGTMGPLPTQAGSRGSDGAAAGGALGGDAAHQGAARRRGMEALGQRPGAGRALHQDGSADSARRNRAGKGRQRDADAAGALEERRCRAALAGRDAVDALQGGAGPGLREVQGLLRAAGGRAPGEPQEEGSAVRARRSAGRFDRLGAHRRSDQAAAGRVEDDRPGDARPREIGVGTLPRRLRSLLHAPAGRPQGAQARVVGQPREEGSAHRRGRAARAVDRVGQAPPAASSSCRSSGRRSARSARTSRK